ncbi:hypothetical protein M3O96_16065 [Aquiflexum sp. TKW24L]|uniref:hypothetical protein n=1 Tax=Aquiflexum sp. TKW24L TaxID=2942212 RepID=UPI0020BD7282|nr:hypothetical protein [Aquiflexum sp. TKW24L]MCL6260620.1 hypothetical protein [Aquiflexum sp. TKW24L]
MALAFLFVASVSSCGGKKEGEESTDKVESAEHPAEGAEHPTDSSSEHPADTTSTN